MSTKTSFKRIAAVAALALTLGGFSAVSAHADPAAGTPTLPIYLDSTVSTFGAGPTTFVSTLTTPVSGVAYTKGLISGSMTGFTVPVNTAVNFGIKASGSTFSATDIADLSLNGLIVASHVLSAALSDGSLTYTFAKAGTYTGNIAVYTTALTRAGATGTYNIPLSITVGSATAFSPGASTVYWQNGPAVTAATAITTASPAIIAPKTEATTTRGSITVNLKDTSASATSNFTSVTATVSGSGYVVADDANTPSATGCPTTAGLRSATISSQNSVANFQICSDGTSGTGTYTVKVVEADGVTTDTLASVPVTFTGSVASLTIPAASINYTIGKAGGAITGSTSSDATHTPAFVVVAEDSNGAVVSGLASGFSFVSSNPLQISTGACLEDTAFTGYSQGGAGYYDCDFTSGTTATSSTTATTLTVRILNPADPTNSTYLTAPISLTIGGKVAKTVLSTDAATYTPGQAMTITETATDASGNPVYDGATATGAVASSVGLGGTAFAPTIFVGGKASSTSSTGVVSVYAPAVEGPVVIAATGTDAAATALSASFTVSGGNASTQAAAATDAANEATDAANAATDAANAAADAADAATSAAQDAGAKADAALAAVTALSAKITVLAAQIAKIVKKLGA